MASMPAEEDVKDLGNDVTDTFALEQDSAYDIVSGNGRERDKARKLQLRSPSTLITAPVFWFRTLCVKFDWRFVVMIIFGEHLLKGLLTAGGTGGLLYYALLFILGGMGTPAPVTQAYISAALAPWALKPVLGFLNDCIPIRGYGKKYYMAGVSLLSTVSFTVLCFFGLSGKLEEMGREVVLLSFLFGYLQCSWSDLMIEGIYAYKMKLAPDYSADILTWVWTGIFGWGMAGYLLAGPVLDWLGIYTTLLIAIPCAAGTFIPSLLNMLTEVRLPKGQRGIQFERLKREKNYFVVSALMAVAVIASTTAAIFADSYVQLMVAIGGTVLVALPSSTLLPTPVYKLMLFAFIANALMVDMRGAAYYFFTDTPDVYPDGPHFSATFFVTVVGIVDSFFGLVGVNLFNLFMKKWTYRRALLVTQLLIMAATLVDTIMFLRWNVAIGLPDWLFMLGRVAVQHTVVMLNFMPTTILLSKLCPEEIETVVYALLAGFLNFGLQMGGYFGMFILSFFGADEINGQPIDDCSPLWKCSLVAMILPLITVLLIPVLIPDLPMTEPLEIEAEDVTDDGQEVRVELEEVS